MIDKVILANDFVTLEPIAESHIDGILEAGQFPEIWQYMPVAMSTKDHVRQFIGYADQVHSDGNGLYFTIVDQSTKKIVGSTGYWNADLANRRVEIGFTWITPGYQRTHVNTACKILLLTHGFESMNLNRVEFKTDSLNLRSQNALKRIGAVEEGTLRQHMIQPDGRLRDSVYFSVIREEWLKVKSNLDQMLKSNDESTLK